MGDFLSGALGTNSQVNTTGASPISELQPYQQTAQNQLIPQLQTEASGGGPNPAQQQYLQNSQQIAQNQANTYAQNRSLNPGLAARMAGNTAAGQQQQAASTAGIQQAQQQLGAQQLEGNVLSQQQTALNQASGVNAQIASGNQQAASGLVGGVMNGIGGMLSMSKGGTVPKYDSGGSVPANPMLYGLSSSVSPGGSTVSPEENTGIAATLSKGMSSLFPKSPEDSSDDSSGGGSGGSSGGGGSSTAGEGSSGMSGLDSLTSGGGTSGDSMGAMGSLGSAAFAKGGQVSPHLKKMADIYHKGVKMDGGGMMSGLMSMLPMLAMAASKGGKVPDPKKEPKINMVPKSDRFDMKAAPHMDGGGMMSGLMSMLPMLAMAANKGGKVPAMVSPGEEYLSPEKAKKVAQGKESPMSGERIPGKAKVKGNSEKNDVVPKDLDAGGIVIPRSAMGSEEDAQKFVAKEMAKHKKSPEGEFREALKRAVAGRKNK